LKLFLTWKSARNHRGPIGIVDRILNKLHAYFWEKTLNYKVGTSKNHCHCGTENFPVPCVWPFSQHCTGALVTRPKSCRGF